MTTAQSRIRCAIYTRKSSEEGLEQSFNSLQAQREACEAFIASQRHECWHALHKHHDDGGFSGGNIDRPALQQLLADVASGRVDTIVVYKVDCLTRSLADFAKIIEVPDQKSVSFVSSPTIQYDDSWDVHSERLALLRAVRAEVTGAYPRRLPLRRKGMWMGGKSSLGYCKQGQLRVNPEEAAVVREIFTQYLRLGCVRQLKRHLDEKQIRSKQRTSAGGRTSGGLLFSRGALYHLLNNQIYLGKIVHHRQAYAGQHEAIVPIDLWQKVTAHLAANNRSHRRPGKRSSTNLLTGLLFDSDGNRYTPTHAVRKGKRYRYYTCQAVIQKQRKPAPTDRLPAAEIEELTARAYGRYLPPRRSR
jgi:DNA invertase Pin-like site-specific DNA recombinase